MHTSWHTPGCLTFFVPPSFHQFPQYYTRFREIRISRAPKITYFLLLTWLPTAAHRFPLKYLGVFYIPGMRLLCDPAKAQGLPREISRLQRLTRLSERCAVLPKHFSPMRLLQQTVCCLSQTVVSPVKLLLVART